MYQFYLFEKSLMLGIFLTILGHISYGTTNVLWKNPRNEIGTLPLILIRSFCCFLIFSAIYIILRHFGTIAGPNFTYIDLVQTVGLCAVNYFGLFFFLKSMKHAPVAKTIGFGKIGLVIGMLVAYFVYDEDISPLKMCLGIVVLIAVSLVDSAGQKRSTVLSKGLIYSVLCKVFWSTAFLYAPFINKLGPILFCAVLELTVFTMTLLLFAGKPKRIRPSEITSRTKKEILLLIFLGTMGTLCLNFALANISIMLFAIIGLIEPVIGLSISKLYHKEYLTKLQQIGIALGISAAFILSVTK